MKAVIRGQNAITVRNVDIYCESVRTRKMAMRVPMMTEVVYVDHPSGMAEIDAKDSQGDIEVMLLKTSSNPLRTLRMIESSLGP